MKLKQQDIRKLRIAASVVFVVFLFFLLVRYVLNREQDLPETTGQNVAEKTVKRGKKIFSVDVLFDAFRKRSGRGESLSREEAILATQRILAKILDQQLQKNTMPGIKNFRIDTSGLVSMQLWDVVCSKNEPEKIPDSFRLNRRFSVVRISGTITSCSADELPTVPDSGFLREYSIHAVFDFKAEQWDRASGIVIENAFPLNWHQMTEEERSAYVEAQEKSLPKTPYDLAFILNTPANTQTFSLAESFRIGYSKSLRKWQFVELNLPETSQLSHCEDLNVFLADASEEKLEASFSGSRIKIQNVWVGKQVLDQRNKLKNGYYYDCKKEKWLDRRALEDDALLRQALSDFSERKISLREYLFIEAKAVRCEGLGHIHAQVENELCMRIRHLAQKKDPKSLLDYADLLEKSGWNKEKNPKAFLLISALSSDLREAQLLQESREQTQRRKQQLESDLTKVDRAISETYAQIKFDEDRKKMRQFFDRNLHGKKQKKFPSHEDLLKRAEALETDLSLTGNDAEELMKRERLLMKAIFDGKYQKTDAEMRKIYMEQAVSAYPKPAKGAMIEIQLRKGDGMIRVTGTYYGCSGNYVRLGDDRYNLIDMPDDVRGRFSDSGLKTLRAAYVNRSFAAYQQQKDADWDLLQKRLEKNSYFKRGVVALKNGTCICVRSLIADLYALERLKFNLGKKISSAETGGAK